MTLHSAEIVPGTTIEGFIVLKVIRTKTGNKRAVLRCGGCLHTFTESTTDLRRYSGHCKYCADWTTDVDTTEHSYLRTIWKGMLRRNSDMVCPRWMSFKAFANDVGPRPAEPEGHFGNRSAWVLTRDDDRKVHAPWNNFWWAPGYSEVAA